MMWQRFILAAGILLLISLAGFAGWIISLPETVGPTGPPPLAQAEAEAVNRSLAPPKRARPVIAIVGINDATETTDYLMPYGILARSGVADVLMVATGPGPVRLFPALAVEPQATLASFDQTYPDGADYVIVPAMSRDNDAAVTGWIKAQAGKGAIIIGVCAGAKVVAAAGLLDGKQATTHWYYLDELRRKHPRLRYVANRRVVVDDGIATTTGITASMPLSLMLIEAIAGRGKAEAVARELGLADWGLDHPSNAFQFTRPFALTALFNTLVHWPREEQALALTPGMDEVSLALVADAWSRTFRSRAVSHAAGPVATRHGLRILPDRQRATGSETAIADFSKASPQQALDETLAAISENYGTETAYLVAMQLEYTAQDALR